MSHALRNLGHVIVTGESFRREGLARTENPGAGVGDCRPSPGPSTPPLCPPGLALGLPLGG